MSALGIVIVNYNSLEDLKELLAKWRQEGEPGRPGVIVDNGEWQQGRRINLEQGLRGNDGGQAWQFLVNKKNRGFARAANQGAESLAGVKFLLFLNPDCWISLADIGKLERFLEQRPKTGIVAPFLLDAQGKEQRWSRGKNWVSGACMLVRRRAFEAVGGFDPEFFMYFEDRDLGWRIKQGGFRVRTCPAVRARHKESNSKIAWSQRKRHYYKAQSYFIRKHYGWVASWVIKLLRLPIFIKNVYGREKN